MVLLELFWSFLKIGFTSFGGLSMIPLISSEMVSHGWMNTGEVTDIVAIAEMTPGPLGLNCATFAGIKTAGIAGAVAANLGVLMPTFTVCLVAAACFEKFKNGRRMGQVMVGVRPVCIGLILAVMVSLSVTNYYIDSAVNLAAVAIGFLDLFLLVKCKVSIPKVLLISAVLGVILT
ncbi:chromate transporter [Clostridium sp. MCC353]|uniref:chromate transporter n=1 Tax=Clostridium sp. MCC353 TaxID=2592646 RepID=UPI001C00C460|nr:chromate transporter [Clostridium sp. MCC353]MBT9780116.1 chromate transporter [Clostridium sp. MCC353]